MTTRDPHHRARRWTSGSLVPALGHRPLHIGLYIMLGLVPLLSFGRMFAVYSATEGRPRYHVVYVLPALAAEALYVWSLV